MSPLTNKLLWIALCAAIGIGILFDLNPLPEETSRVHRIPSRGIGFSGMDIPLSKGELSLYNKAEVVKRCYLVGRYQFMLIAIDGAKNRHAVHDPMYCFQGAGWRAARKEEVPIESGKAMLLHLKRDAKVREVVYWFSDGKSRHTSVVRYWIQATFRRISMGHSGQEPILVILQPIQDETINFTFILNQFGALFEV